jgi:RNA polymerase sigma-70 factor (ECF subfamily)
MDDITLYGFPRLEPGVSEADDALQMDQESFRTLYERTARPLWLYLRRKSGDSLVADDLLQETYYRFLRTRVLFESEKHQKNYLFRIATNLAHDSRRHPHREAQLPADDDRGAFRSDSSTAEESHRRRDLERAMAQLKPRQRDALWLAYAEGSTHEEIAAVLGTKVHSVKLILFRARRKLASLLSGETR